MELQKKALEYQRKVAFETVYREESSDCIVPDSQPDIDRILDVCAVSCIRDRETDQDEVKLRCTVHAVVLYVAADDDRVYSVETSISYTHPAQVRGARSGDEVICDAVTVSSDARMLNPRKISVRVNTAFRLEVYRQDHAEVAYGSAEEGCCTKTVNYSLMYPEALTVKNFTIVEDIDIDAQLPPAQKAYCAQVHITPLDIKLLAGRATVRAQVHVKALYESTEGRLCALDKSFGFTQSADVAGIDEDNTSAEVKFYLRNFDLECSVDMSGESRYLSLSAGVTMSVLVSTLQEFDVLQDMYGLDRQIDYQEEELVFAKPQKALTAALHVSEQIDTPEPILNVVFCRLSPDRSFEISDDVVVCSVSASIIYQATNGTLYGIGKRISLRFSAQDADVSGAELNLGEAIIMSTGSGIELGFDASISYKTKSDEKINMIDQAQWGEEYPPDERDLSAILTKMHEGESIWDLARRYRTTSEAITQANPDINADDSGARLVMIPL